MGSLLLINQVIEWERKLEYDEERRKYHHFEPYVNYLATLQPCPKERKSFFPRIFQRRKESQMSIDVVKALTGLPSSC